MSGSWCFMMEDGCRHHDSWSLSHAYKKSRNEIINDCKISSCEPEINQDISGLNESKDWLQLVIQREWFGFKNKGSQLDWEHIRYAVHACYSTSSFKSLNTKRLIELLITCLTRYLLHISILRLDDERIFVQNKLQNISKFEIQVKVSKLLESHSPHGCKHNKSEGKVVQKE